MVFCHHNNKLCLKNFYMKKDELLRKLHEIDSERQIKLIAVFNSDEHLPMIAVTKARCRKRWEDMAIGYVTNLAKFKSEFEKLADGDLFVFGRSPECEHRLGLEIIKDSFKKNNSSEKNAEQFYMNHCSTISRLHCFVMRNGKSYLLYDCSISGTSILY